MDSAKQSESVPTNNPSANEPSGPIGRLSHDHIDLEAEERRHRREKRAGQPVMAIILGLTLLTAVIFYVLHLRAVAKEEAEAKQRALAAAALAEAAAKEAQKAVSPPAPATAPATAPAATPTPPATTDKGAAPQPAKPAEAKPAEAKPATKAEKPARPAKKADDSKTKSLPRLPVLPEG